MSRWSLHLLLALASLTSPAGANVAPSPPGYPHIILSNAQFQVTAYVPDPTNGYYRAVRFDWSSLLAAVHYAGQTIFGEWKNKRSPTGSDDVAGPAEEFGMVAPPGYAEAAVGEPFLKIGVGLLQKTRTNQYAFSQNYPLLDAGQWTTTHGTDWIEFRHVLPGTNGWGYVYTKRLALAADQPQFTITRHLQNTGTNTIATDHYSHNFVVFNNEPVAPPLRIHLPFAAPSPRVIHNDIEIAGNEIRVLRPIKPGKGYWAQLDGSTGTVADNNICFEHPGHGLRLRVTGDRPPLKLVFYAIGKAICVEPFVAVHVAPGATLTWRNTYTLEKFSPP